MNLTELTRPFGGGLVYPSTVPYVVLILGKNSGAICTGNLIAMDLVLTLARCMYSGTEVVEDPQSLRILGGVYNIENITSQYLVQEATVKKIFIHPNFVVTDIDISFGYNDIALILLEKELLVTETVRSIPLGTISWGETPSVHCRVAGYGALNPLSPSPDDDYLKLIEVVAVKTCTCDTSLNEHFGPRVQRWICLSTKEGNGPCVGHGGSGLVCKGKLVGFIVGLIPFVDLDQCIFLHSPTVTCDNQRSISVFLNICPFVNWIHFLFPTRIQTLPQACSAVSHDGKFSINLIFAILLGTLFLRM